MTQGYILSIDDNRRYEFSNSANTYDRFVEPVPSFSHHKGYPLVIFVSTKKGHFTHLASGKLGQSAGTALKKLTLTKISDIDPVITAKEILTHCNPKFRTHIKRILGTGGLLPQKTFTNFIFTLMKLNDELQPLLEQYMGQGETFQRLPKKMLRALAYQKEAVTTALAIAGIERDSLSSWRVNDNATNTASFLDGLSQTYMREDEMIFNDMSFLPGFELVQEFTKNRTMFQNSTATLEVIIANRTVLEEQTGADLIYYNQDFHSFVMVQYKAMEKEVGKEAVFRLPNLQLAKEIDQMLLTISQLGVASCGSRHDFRLNNNPFFIKLCPRIDFTPDSTEMTKGMYFNLDQWKLLETDCDLVGSKGGRLITYSNVGRHLNNSEFASLVGNAWIGTTQEQSRLIEGLVKEIYQNGKAVVFAIKKAKDKAYKVFDEAD